MNRPQHRRLLRSAILAPALLAGAANADTPRAELGGGLWQHESAGSLASDDALLQVGPGFDLSDEQETYARFSVRLGSKWWSPMLRARHTSLSTRGYSFVDDSTLVFEDTTETTTYLDFEQQEGLLYFTYGDVFRGELGGGLKKIDGHIQTVQTTNTSLAGINHSRSQRELPSELPVAYGALYVEPTSWLSFGGEAIASTDSDNEVVDFSFRFIVKPWTAMGVEGGYRQITMTATDVDNTEYDLQFGGPYAGLSFLYGSKDAGLFSPDGDADGVTDGRDRCRDSTPGAIVDARGCEPDVDGDKVPDGRDDCRGTPRGAEVDASGCHKDTDRDSIADGLDQCPNTPAGVAVDPQGCPQDRDGDGVSDEKDQCVGTPAGVEVDASGCERSPDADRDGVPDALDQCPGGAAGAVDDRGCPLSGPASLPPARADVADEDRDGVPDVSDRCRRTLRGLRVDRAGCATRAQSTVLQGVTFLVNSSYLQRDSEVLLLEVVESLKAQPTLKVVIEGHTCDLGVDKYNKWLSQRRANRVLEFLVRHGIDAKRLLAVGHGEERPLVPNDDERMRELNRRTVFTVVEQ